MNPPDRLPPWATTGVGSLPFGDVDLAVTHGRVAWGVVQPHRPEHGRHAVDRLRAGLAAVDAGGGRSLLTASCGSGRLSPEREGEIATALSDARSIYLSRAG